MQNNRYTSDDLIKAKIKLPRKVIRAIMNNHVDKIIKDIVVKYHLRIDQSAVLEDEITYVMYGLERPENFLKNLKKEARLDNSVASSIAKNIEQEIFLPIKKELMEIHDPNYKSPNQEEWRESYDDLMKKIYIWAKEAEDYEGMEKIKKDIDQNAKPEDTIDDLLRRRRENIHNIRIRTSNDSQPTKSSLQLQRGGILEMTLKNPPKGTLSNIIDLRSKKDDTGPRPIGETSFLIKERPENVAPVTINLEDEIKKEEIKIDLEERKIKKDELVLDLDKDEPEINPATEIKKSEVFEQTKTNPALDKISQEELEPSIIERTMSGPVITKNEEKQTFDSPLKKPDIEIKPISSTYVGEKDPYREPID